MKCIICSSQMEQYFNKRFDSYGLSDVEYWRCICCELVMSKTHKEMDKHIWNRLNKNYHLTYQGSDYDANDPRWILRLNDQAEVIADLKNLNLIKVSDSWVDYGCGDGKLSEILFSKYTIKVEKYDKNKHGSDYLSKRNLKKRNHDLVISTSVMEHISDQDELEFINDLVSDIGVLAVHTFVSDDIKPDPTWFYLLPTHCTFFTNKSMQILFDRWGYESSIYNVNSRLWFWFKNDSDTIENIVQSANNRLGVGKLYYHFKRGFMDYWK